MRKRILYFLTAALLFFGANFFILNIESQIGPFTMGQILRAIASINQATGNQKKVFSDKIIKDIRQRKVEFPLTRENEKLLRDEGASNEFIEVIRQNSPPLPTRTPVSTPTPSRTPTDSSKNTFKNSIGMEFVRIPAGTFMMGGDQYDNEKPVHRVTINYEFYMGKFEVTIGEWKKVMGDLPEGMKTDLDNKFKESDNQPVVGISWNDAQDFIKKLNVKNDGFTYRLPSEAEWEYAARAGTTTEFAFGNDLSSNQANFDGNYPYGNAAKGKYLQKTVNVGSYQPNAWGLYDMHGNVWEWVEDIYNSSYNNLPINGSVNLSVGDSSYRVLRGGSWDFYGYLCRSAYRLRLALSFRSYFGFRVVARAS